jgi:tRNA 2-selenouridine synthase
MIRDRNPAELFEYIRSIDVSDTPSLKSILGEYKIEKFPAEQVLINIKENKDNILLIDARSEMEFAETSLPFSKNFPVLKNNERHNTGLIYKKYSQTSALWLAMQYADPKSVNLKNFLEENNAADKIIFVYCWRGGGRSGYLSKMISDLGFNPSVITGGYKSYRKLVNDFFSEKTFPYGLLELSGLTGSGKTELLNNVSGSLPVIDLENAARHYSSLLGQIPYDINNIEPVKNQTAFENNLFANIFLSSDILSNSTDTTSSAFLIESESKKVGNFEVPASLYDKLIISPTVKIVSSMECRVERIVRDYFGEDLRGIVPMRNKLIDKEIFFKQQLSSKLFNELIDLLDSGRVNEFTEIMIADYYDKRYKDKGKKPIAEISTDNMSTAKNEISEIYKRFLSL